MKKYISFTLGILLTMILFSCTDYLNINTNPNTPTDASSTLGSTLAGTQHYLLYSYGCAGARSALITGTMTTAYNASATRSPLAAWNPTNAMSLTPYQCWFVYSAANIDGLIARATAQGAWDYVGAANVIHALGFMTMLDWYGEMPYSEALGDFPNPKYDDGKTIFNGCIAKLDEAIANFNTPQAAGAESLKDGDGWNGGDVNKWKALAYGLKARWLNNLSKKSSYNTVAILDALDHAAQSNAEATVVKHFNLASDQADHFVGDPLKTSMGYNNLAMSSYYFITKWYADLLTNTFTGGSGVLDPRADKLIPSAEYTINGVKKLVRSTPVDMIHSSIRLDKGPSRSTYSPSSKTWKSSTVARPGDTTYVCTVSHGAMYYSLPDGDETYRNTTDQTILSTGTFYTRPDGPTPVVSYPELCFIRAEVLYRTGDKGGALVAYKNGIRAHMDLMNAKLSEYPKTNNTGKDPMLQSDIDAFMASAAVAQTVGDLTMAKIMQQKFIACSYSVQNWNDMRRFDYSAGDIADFGVVYPDYDRPYEFGSEGGNKMIGTAKTDPRYWFRRMMQCDKEVSFNTENLKASNPEALLPTIWSDPVWWDTPDE